MPDTRFVKQLIQPLPAVHAEELEHVGSGLRFMESPTRYLADLRQRHGDTFLLDVFGYHLLMTFSAQGLSSLYAFEEADASFHAATFDLIRFKTPIEILYHVDVRLFYRLLQHKHMPDFLAVIDQVVELELARWEVGSELELFDAIRTLEQRVGFGLWIGQEAATDGRWQALKLHFDVLDQESAFVNPAETLNTIKSDKAREKEAAAALYEILRDILAERAGGGDGPFSAADFLGEHFAGEEHFEQKVFNNIINANQGFLSNLYAAIAWVLVWLLVKPEVLARVEAEITDVRARFGSQFPCSVEALNELIYLEQVMMEAVRLGQRSLTLRKVMRTAQFDDGERSYQVSPGLYIATMLSVTNASTEDLARFDPDNYARNRWANRIATPGPETISTFGHGRHACPAQRFSLHMVKIVITRVLDRFRLEPAWTVMPTPSDRQMGGVARPGQPACVRVLSR
ncbi:MAG: hypothetical protein Hals2KO_07610 [Halioglobus sp.]